MKTEKDESGVSPAAGTPRFTHNEKSLLYKLFQDNEDVIDIKFRKVSKQKMSVREAWEKIVHSYNSNPSITTKRNYKQIQKFWLNARLRKQYPSKNNASETISSTMIKQEHPGSLEIKHMKTLESPKSQSKQCTEDMDMDDNLIEEDPDYEEEEIILPSRTVPAQTEYVDVSGHHQAYAQIPTQQISVDQISADKLTLNDLLQFKSSRPQDQDIILQIKEQPHSQTKLQIASLHNNAVSTSVASNTAQQHQETPIHSYYTTTTQNLDFQFDVNYFKTKEAELKIKEEQLQFEKKKIELARAQQELENMKIVHALQVEKLKLEIRILQENLKNK